ncbi:hypothetical protein KKG90_02630, partial [Candidatus Bipolaricaulota bacterium]|nr:hypothetical protein [Candidatus Bipolaricaulota bacterium]
LDGIEFFRVWQSQTLVGQTGNSMASSSFEFGKAKLWLDKLETRWHRVLSGLAKPNSARIG